MLNDYGERLDRNGYAPSIVPGHGPRQCWLCGRNGSRDKLDRHEIFHGPYRDKSKALGLWVHLCHERCHLDTMHGWTKESADLETALRRTGQRAAMETYGWTAAVFADEFGRNYLEEKDGSV